MITDVATVLWKEIKEIFIEGPKLRGGWIGMLIFIGVFGVVLPLQSGPEWLSSPATLLVWSWVPLFLVNSVVADSFAGERERHTLETLLASRLSDRAILFGKLLAALAYGWGLTLAGLFASVVTINLVHGQGQFLFFPAGIALGILAFSLLVALLAATIGVLVSLRASSVRQAQQTVSTAMFIFLIPLILLPMLPESWREGAAAALGQINAPAIAAGAAVLLIALDAILLVVAMLRFQRTRLILD